LTPSGAICNSRLKVSVDSWHPGRAEDGFKWSAKERQEQCLMEILCQWSDEEWEGQAALAVALEEDTAPMTVLPVARYLRDLECLQGLTSPTKPPKQLYQAAHLAAFFVIRDASGKAKGSAVVEQ
jgi:hypothetical protein